MWQYLSFESHFARGLLGDHPSADNKQKFFASFFQKRRTFFFSHVENCLFAPILRAVAQLGDPALLAVLIQTVLLSAACFAGLAGGSVWFVHHLIAHGTWGWLAGAIGGGLALLAALWLFIPIAVVIAGLFMEPVCRAVERRWYPLLPPPGPAGLLSQGWDGVVLGVRVMALSLFGLLLGLFLPGIGQCVGWLITSWALGRGMFAAVAMRRMSRAAALAAYHENRLAVLVQGALLTAGGVMPLLNLLLPIVGPAAMVHLVQGRLDKSESWK
jgi:uncharacterized protein involved in cysteine biosynthesis